eukprot:3855276-Pleurochrysis_carterae.AAC.1
MSEEDELRSTVQKVQESLGFLRSEMKRLLSPELPLGTFQLRGFEFAEAEASVREAALCYMWKRKYGDVYTEILHSNPSLA